MKLIFVIVVVFLTKTCSSQTLCESLEAQAVNDVTPECMDQLLIMCNNGSLWWRMVDASSKYPISGMSYGSNKDLGNYDECIDIDYEDFAGKVKGKYCGYSVAIVNLYLEPIPSPFNLDIKPRLLANVPQVNYNKTVRDATDDYSISLLSLCVPDKCTPKEVGMFFVWGHLADMQIVNFPEVLPCMMKDSNTTFRAGDIVFTCVLAFFLCLIVLSTGYDFLLLKLERKPSHPIYLAFSFITNGNKLLHTSQGKNPNQITCLNGMRFISMMWVIAGHGFVAMEQLPLINYSTIANYLNQMKTQYMLSAPIAVDTFFFLSGFLLSYGYLKNAVKLPVRGQLKSIPMMIVHRYLRLTPALAMLFFTTISIYRMTGTGPMWAYIANDFSRQCTEHWWSFFLYIQNYVNYDDFCLTHAWYLSADMQMFILAPIVLIPLAELSKNNKRNEALIGLGVLIVICVFFPMGIRYADDTIDNVYDTHSRFNNYLIGVLLGFIMRDPRFQKFPFSKLTNLAIWCFVFNACVAFNLYYHNILRIYDHISDTTFYGLYRPVWCLSLAWLVYSCYHGYGGPVNWFLSLPAFQIGARLSYCMYLVHAVVEMYFVGLVRTPYNADDYTIFYLWCGHFIVTMILSTIWTLAFESPMIVIEKFIFGGAGRKPKKEGQAQ
ncbi:nose resistant to fluoxetine protein 6-like [Zophobas morio]|uniref:nose resistant to fluoxetine protein 6-like n=1 Tax=Zophobas morio TaxID=2755281 RepID=UPI003083B407